MTTSLRHILLAFLVSLSFAACDDAGVNREAHPTTLVGTAWRVLFVNGRAPVVRSEPTASFAAGQVKGSAGCNSYGGSYQYEPSTGAIAFRDLAMTAMGCLEPGTNEFETLFINTFSVATAASIDQAGNLVLLGPSGQIVLTPTVEPASVRDLRSAGRAGVGWIGQRGGRMAASSAGSPVGREESPSSSAQGSG